MNLAHVLSCAVILISAVEASAQEAGASRITSVGLFKNGLAVVTKEYTVPGPGSYTFDAIGDPIHGTFWIECGTPVTARTETRQVEAPPEDAVADLGGALAGQEVEIGFRTPDQPAITGTLIAAPPTLYALTLPDGHRRYVAADSVAYVQSLGAVNVGKIDKPVLIFDVPESASGPVSIRARYLARGLAWAPAYRIELSGPDTLSIAQSAVIRNELEDLDGVEVELISGFPSVEFEHVTSPFAAGVSWSTFFSSLARRPGENPQVMAQSILSNNAQFFDPADFFPAAPAAGEGPDLYYQPAGKLSLGTGGALTQVIATAEAAYSPVVEWRVPDIRSGRGASPDSAENQQADMWDAVRFKNPFPFPMTTGPAMVMANGRFLGSRTTRWANPGDETLAYISKTLSVRAAATETETDRTETTEFRRLYWKSALEGTLTVQNRRNEAVAMVIHKQMDGTLIEAEGGPERTVGAAGPGQLNASVKLTWRVTLAPGEERRIKYQYEYLVP